MPINTSQLVGDVIGSVLSAKVAREMNEQKQIREADSDAAELEKVENLLDNEDNHTGEGSKLDNNLESANSDKLIAEQAMNKAIAKEGTAPLRNEKGQFRKKADIEAENSQYEQDAYDTTETYLKAEEIYNVANGAMQKMIDKRKAWENSSNYIREKIARNSEKNAVYANRMKAIRGVSNKDLEMAKRAQDAIYNKAITRFQLDQAIETRKTQLEAAQSNTQRADENLAEVKKETKD